MVVVGWLGETGEIDEDHYFTNIEYIRIDLMNEGFALKSVRPRNDMEQGREIRQRTKTHTQRKYKHKKLCTNSFWTSNHKKP